MRIRISIFLALSVAVCGSAAQDSVFNPLAYAPRSFGLSGGGLVLTVRPGAVSWADGRVVKVAGGSVKVAASATNYIFLDLEDLSFHAFPRAIHSGGLYLGAVVTGAAGVLSIAQSVDFPVPPNAAESFKRKLSGGRTNLYCVVAGDSLSADWGSYMSWAKAIFTPPVTNFSFALPQYTNCIYDNVALGGSSSIWSWALLCSSSVYGVQGASFLANGVTFVNRDVGASLTNGPVQTGVESPILARSPDLLIIGFGANRDDTYDALALETIVREYTARGCAVVITTENKYGGPMPLDEAGGFLQSIADRYGAAIADTYSYVFEKNVVQGTNTYQGDGVHQVQEGWNCYARAVRSVLNDYVQRDGARCVGVVPRVSLNATNGFGTNGPNWVHVQPAKWASAGSASDVSGLSSGSLASKVCGVPLGQAVQKVSTKLYFSFPVATAVYMVTECNVGTNLSVDVYRDVVPTLVKTVTVTGSGNGIQVTKLFSEAEIRGWNSWDTWAINQPEYRPFGFSVGTNGASVAPLTLSAMLYLGPKLVSVAPATVQTNGVGWSVEPWRYNSIDYPQEPMWFNDATNGSMTVLFTGNGIILPVVSGSAAAMVSAWVDGEQLLTSQDMYISSSNEIVRYFTLLPRNRTGSLPLWFNYGAHTLRLTWPGQNGSVAASNNGLRRVGVLQSLVGFDTR